MENTPDSNLTPENYAQILQQSMAAALANVDAMQAEARKAHDAALDELAAARETRKQIESEARSLATEQVEKYYLEIKEQIREQTLRQVTESLLNACRTSEEIQEWLDVQPAFVEDVKKQLSSKTQVAMPPWWFNIDDIDTRKAAAESEFGTARVLYKQTGRGGTVFFEQNDVSLKFDWEFGGGDAIALIFVPTEEQWELATGLPLEKRMPILDFVGQRVLADQGGKRFEISGAVLSILKS